MKIYRGSKKIIESPKVKGSDSTNDYGPSFYLSLDLNAAKSWAYKNDVLDSFPRFNVTITNSYVVALTCFIR